MKAFVFAFLAALASATQSTDAVADAEACQSGGLIQKRLDSQKAVLTDEANLGLNSSKTKGTKKMRQKKKKLQEEHADLMAFLAKSREASSPPEGSKCERGAPLMGKDQERFNHLLQKVNALNMDAIIARLVKKGDYVPEIAKRAADEYRKFLVLQGMGRAPVASPMVKDAWQAHIMYTKMYEEDCQQVFGHVLEHDPTEHVEAEGLQQTQQQLCDYFGMVDRTVWKEASTTALGMAAATSQKEGQGPGSATTATMQAWLDHINEKREFRRSLLADNVHMVVITKHNNTVMTYSGIDEVLPFFHYYGHATRAREFLSVDGGAFAIESTKSLRMGTDVMEVDAEGKIFDIKIWMGSLREDQEDLSDDGLVNVSSAEKFTDSHTGNGSQALLEVGARKRSQDPAVTSGVMEKWMANVNDDAPEPHAGLFATDAHLMLISEEDTAVIFDGAEDVMNFFRRFGHASTAREFLAVDGGAFLVEIQNNLRMGVFVFQVNGEGKIFDVKIWMASLRTDTADLNDHGLTPVNGTIPWVQPNPSMMLQGGERPLASSDASSSSGVCQTSSTPPSSQQMQRFAAAEAMLAKLDLAPVTSLLVQKEGYSPAKAADLAEEYRKYLILVKTGLNPVPSKKVDDAWHAHILHTQKYRTDMKAIFGHFIHHEPANLLLEQSGMKEQKSEMDNKYADTKMQICDYFGRVNEEAWSKDIVAGCLCSCGCACACACGCGCSCVCGCR